MLRVSNSRLIEIIAKDPRYSKMLAKIKEMISSQRQEKKTEKLSR